MAVFVTLIIDGTIGMVLTYALVIALVLSLIMTLLLIKAVKVKPVMASRAISKGDKLECEIWLENKMILPASLIEVEIDASAHFSVDGEKKLIGSVSSRSVNTLNYQLIAKHSGLGHVRIQSVNLTDYLGIFSFKIKIPETDSDLTVPIYPDIPLASVQTNMIKNSSQFLSSDDEEESDETSLTPTGLAGYDHREYVVGDPIKRINWKASSKRDILLVRLDERIKGSGRTFLLDLPYTLDNDLELTVRDNVIEGTLALLNSLLAEGREATVYYKKQNMWISAVIHTTADVYMLQEEMSDFEAEDSSMDLPPKLLSGKSLICLSSAMDYSYMSAENVISHFPDSILITSYAATLPIISQNQWVISDDFDINKV